MNSHELKIEGMHCDHCVMAVKRELGRIRGLDVLEVSVGGAKVSFNEKSVSREALAEAIDEAGYRLISIA